MRFIDFKRPTSETTCWTTCSENPIVPRKGDSIVIPEGEFLVVNVIHNYRNGRITVEIIPTHKGPQL